MLTDEEIDTAIEAHGALAVVRAADHQMRGEAGNLADLGLAVVTMGDVVRAMWRAQDRLSPREARHVAAADRIALASAYGVRHAPLGSQYQPDAARI